MGHQPDDANRSTMFSSGSGPSTGRIPDHFAQDFSKFLGSDTRF